MFTPILSRPLNKKWLFLSVNNFPRKIFDLHTTLSSTKTPKSFHTLTQVDKDIPALRNLKRWQCSMRWWEGWRLDGLCTAWPSGGIRFDWIGVGDLCIKLRLPCDPAFRREIHTAVRGRACGGSPLTSCALPGSIRVCPALLGLWVVLRLLLYSFHPIVFYYNPFHSVLF